MSEVTEPKSSVVSLIFAFILILTFSALLLFLVYLKGLPAEKPLTTKSAQEIYPSISIDPCRPDIYTASECEKQKKASQTAK